MIECLCVSDHYVPMNKAPGPRIPKEMHPEAIGARLKLIREAFDLQPSQMADLLEINRTYWTRFEKGHRVVSDEVAYLLTERFGVTLDFIVLGKWDKLPLDVAEKLRSAMRKNT